MITFFLFSIVTQHGRSGDKRFASSQWSRLRPHELGKLQEISITMRLRASIKKAGETDRVEDTINNRTVAKEVLFHFENKKYSLIEAVATDVARICVVRQVRRP